MTHHNAIGVPRSHRGAEREKRASVLGASLQGAIRQNAPVGENATLATNHVNVE